MNCAKKRGIKAFSITQNHNNNTTSKQYQNKCATIIMEHLILGSDVAHTHWHVYRKWCKKLFQEMYCS